MSEPKKRQPGRPRKGEPKDGDPVYFRVTLAERKELESAAKRAGSRTVSEWARASLIRLARGIVP
jgi:hypothetical protein